MVFSIRAAVVAVAGLTLATGVGHAQAGPVKIGYVDATAIMNAAPGRAEAESTFAKETAAADAELQKLGADIDALIQELQKSQATLTQVQKDAKGKTITDKQQAAQARQAQLQAKLANRKDEITAPLREAVKKVLDDIRTEDGYTMILDNAVVLSADKNLDITDRVVARLRTMAATKGPVNQPAGVSTKKPPPSRE